MRRAAGPVGTSGAKPARRARTARRAPPAAAASPRPGNGHAFLGASVNRIVVDPANSAHIWVATDRGLSGASGSYPVTSADLGLYYSKNATAARGSHPAFFA